MQKMKTLELKLCFNTYKLYVIVMRNHKMIVNLLKKLCFLCVFGYDSYREVHCSYNSIPVFLIEVFLECLTLVLIITKMMFNSNK